MPTYHTYKCKLVHLKRYITLQYFKPIGLAHFSKIEKRKPTNDADVKFSLQIPMIPTFIKTQWHIFNLRTEPVCVFFHDPDLLIF